MSKMLVDGMDMKDIALSIDKVMARPVGKSGKYEIYALDKNGDKVVLRKAANFKPWVNFYSRAVNGNARDYLAERCSINSKPNSRGEGWVGAFGVFKEDE